MVPLNYKQFPFVLVLLVYRSIKCPICHKCCSNGTSKSFGQYGNVLYVPSLSDPHIKMDLCSTPPHIYADLLFSAKWREHRQGRDDFRGNFYFIKHDPLKLEREHAIGHKFTSTEIIKYDTTLNCDETDLNYIRGVIGNLVT